MTKFSKSVENTVGKGEIARYVFFQKQTRKNQDFFGKGLRYCKILSKTTSDWLKPYGIAYQKLSCFQMLLNIENLEYKPKNVLNPFPNAKF